MATTATSTGPRISRSFSEIEGNQIGNRILLNLPERECALIYPQLTFFVDDESRDECCRKLRTGHQVCIFLRRAGMASVLNVPEVMEGQRGLILGKRKAAPDYHWRLD